MGTHIQALQLAAPLGQHRRDVGFDLRLDLVCVVEAGDQPLGDSRLADGSTQQRAEHRPTVYILTTAVGVDEQEFLEALLPSPTRENE